MNQVLLNKKTQRRLNIQQHVWTCIRKCMCLYLQAGLTPTWQTPLTSTESLWRQTNTESSRRLTLLKVRDGGVSVKLAVSLPWVREDTRRSESIWCYDRVWTLIWCQLRNTQRFTTDMWQKTERRHQRHNKKTTVTNFFLLLVLYFYYNILLCRHLDVSSKVL